MKSLFVAFAILVLSAGGAPAQSPDVRTSLTAAYENLASMIIELRDAESSLMQAILTEYRDSAVRHLDAAAAADKAARRPHLEAAAADIGFVANEGDKAVQAILQRLLKSGHHHHTDGVTEEDYQFVDSVEKKSFLDLAAQVGRMDGSDVAAIRAAKDKLGELFGAAIVKE